MRNGNTITAPKAILDCQLGFFSIAKYYGGAKAYGCEYKYIIEKDALIRSDLMKSYERLRKQGLEFDEILKRI